MMKGYNKWLAVIGACMGSMAMGLSFSLITTHLETIHQQFNASIVELQWMINLYGIFIASLLVTMGRLGDIFGRKKIYLAGTVLFAISMMGTGFAASPKVIIGFMALYGVSGAVLLPLSQALLIDCFSDEKKSIAISIWAAANGVTLSLGPVVGGLLLYQLSWRWIFLSNVPFAILGLILTGCFARESRTNGESTKIDWIGLLLLILAIGGFVLATVQSNLWPLKVTIPIYALTIAAITALVIVEKRVEMPIIREDLFRSRTFLLCSIGALCMIAVFWAGIFLIPFYYQKVLGFEPLQTGMLMLAFSLPMALISPIIGYLCQHLGIRLLIAIGFLLFMLSAWIQLRYNADTPLSEIILATFFLGLGFSIIWTPTTTGALSAISKNFAGIASGTYITLQEIGGNIGLAVSATAARYGTSFESGFHNGIWVIFILSVIGLISAFFIPKKPKKLQKLS